MKDLCHQHICKLYQVIETEEKFFLVLEVSKLSYSYNFDVFAVVKCSHIDPLV